MIASVGTPAPDDLTQQEERASSRTLDTHSTATDSHTSNPEPAGLQSLSLRSNFAWTLMGNVIYSACQWGMLVALARFGTPATLGRFALVFAISAPIFMFTNLQLRAVQATDSRRVNAFGDYLALRLLTTGVAFAATAVIAFASGLSAAVLAVLAAVTVAKALDSISDTFYGLLQQHERMDRIAISMAAKGLLSLAAFALALWLAKSLLSATIAMAGAWAVVMLSYDIPTGRLILHAHSARVAPRWCWNDIYRLAVLALPLGFVMMLVSLNTNIPRYAIQRYLGEHDLGVYAAVAALLVAGSTIVSALGQSASPRLASYYANARKAAFLRLTARLIGIGAALGIGGVILVGCFGGPILGLIYGPAYAMHISLFVWIAIAAGVSYLQSFTGYAVTSARCFRAQAPLLAVVSFVTLVASFCLVPVYGLVGAAVSLAMASIVHLAGNSLLLWQAVRRLPEPSFQPVSEVANG